MIGDYELTLMRDLYLEDTTPWILGYSGGKDSTAMLHLCCLMLESLAPSDRHKPVHVISTDTRVENPIISTWLQQQHASLAVYATRGALPIHLHCLQPDILESFWVNLIGRGYPAPRVKFRWCTDRLKIQPSNRFILSIVQKQREAILLLGTRKAESVARATTMQRHEEGRLRERLSPNGSLPGALVYSAIETWSNDDVWMFLMQRTCPWDATAHKALLSLYRSASADNECPIVVDTSSPSCGASRFGCWTCTMVEQDKSLSAMVENDPSKEWLLPLRELRDRLDIRNDRHLRDFRRMDGRVQIMPNGANIPGPYHQQARLGWLVDLLQTEQHVRRLAPPEFAALELISREELEAIQHIWVREKGELEDELPDIVTRYRHESWPQLSEVPRRDVDVLRTTIPNRRWYEFVRDVWAAHLTHKTWTSTRGTVAASLRKELEKVGRRYMYSSAEEAIGAVSHQPLLFHPTQPDPISHEFIPAALATLATKSNAAPWVALAYLDRKSGQQCRSNVAAYVAEYYGKDAE